MKALTFALLFTLGFGAAAEGDRATLSGNPLGEDALEVASILVDHRAELRKYWDNAGIGDAGLMFARGTVQKSIRDSAFISLYTIEVMMCGEERPQGCFWIGNLIIEKTVTDVRRKLKPAYKFDFKSSGLG